MSALAARRCGGEAAWATGPLHPAGRDVSPVLLWWLPPGGLWCSGYHLHLKCPEPALIPRAPDRHAVTLCRSQAVPGGTASHRAGPPPPASQCGRRRARPISGTRVPPSTKARDGTGGLKGGCGANAAAEVTAGSGGPRGRRTRCVPAVRPSPHKSHTRRHIAPTLIGRKPGPDTQEMDGDGRSGGDRAGAEGREVRRWITSQGRLSGTM